MNLKNLVRSSALFVGFLAATLGAQAQVFTDGPNGTFSNAVTTASAVALALQTIFYAVLPIALVIGLAIWGYRMAKRLAR